MQGFGILQRVFFVSFLPLLAFSCESLEDDLYKVTLNKEGYLRMEVQKRFRTAIFLNTQECSTNYDAGLYAMERVLSEEVIRVRYEKSSVEFCEVMLIMTPCGLDMTDLTISTNLYRSVIRSCGLKQLGV